MSTQRRSTIRGPLGGKKRLIRKKVIHEVFAPVIALDSVNLDTIEEKETLVRIVGNVSYDSILANLGQITTEIKLDPSGTSMLGTTIADSEIDGRDAGVILFGHQFASSHDTAGSVLVDIPIDIKAMRKLQKGDQITLYADASVDNGYVGNLYLTLFFKKA